MLHHVSLLYTHLAKNSEHDQMLFAKKSSRAYSNRSYVCLNLNRIDNKFTLKEQTTDTRVLFLMDETKHFNLSVLCVLYKSWAIFKYSSCLM